MIASQLFVIDPIARLNPAKDSSVALMQAVQRAGQAVWVCTPADLSAVAPLTGQGSGGHGTWALAQPVQLGAIALEAGAWCIGRSVAAIDLPFLNAQLTLIRRGNARIPSPSADEKLQVGDVLVVRGDAQALAAAEMRLIQGQI